MSGPKLTVKLRTKSGVPFSIETLTGRQFRCGVCGNVYWYRKELDRHLEIEKSVNYTKLQFPELDRNINVRVIYTQDIRDLTNPKYPRLVRGDKLLKIDEE
jgi:uncharacterized C2H2 Zn-finger protein